MTSEERIARLEEQAYFQEQLVAQLNEALTSQQKQIDALETHLDRMEKLVQMLADESSQDAPVQTLPPHYMPERY